MRVLAENKIIACELLFGFDKVTVGELFINYFPEEAFLVIPGFFIVNISKVFERDLMIHHFFAMSFLSCSITFTSMASTCLCSARYHDTQSPKCIQYNFFSSVWVPFEGISITMLAYFSNIFLQSSMRSSLRECSWVSLNISTAISGYSWLQPTNSLWFISGIAWCQHNIFAFSFSCCLKRIATPSFRAVL